MHHRERDEPFDSVHRVELSFGLHSASTVGHASLRGETPQRLRQIQLSNGSYGAAGFYLGVTGLSESTNSVLVPTF
jgi:hypothetical protein